MTALAMAGDEAHVRKHLEALGAHAGKDTVDTVYAAVGRPVCEAVAAFGAGDSNAASPCSNRCATTSSGSAAASTSGTYSGSF